VIDDPDARGAPKASEPQPAKKLVLGVIDALKPEMLDRAITEGRAPALAALRERGLYVRDCVAAFPSLTPVCAASIATGLSVENHEIPSTNWYHRGEERYVEYGSSLVASYAHGVRRSLIDTVYNLNLAHLTRTRRTVFEHLDDAGLRTAGTTYLIYRGRTRHAPAAAGMYPRIARAAQFNYGTWGPGELFYADIFASRETPCTSTLGMPGQRDQHTGCVGAHLVENDLFDFLLFSLPDNDTHSHRRGPYAQVTSIAAADRALERIMHVAGGVDAFLENHSVIVMSDHSQTAVEDMVSLHNAFGDLGVLAPGAASLDDADVAVCPTGRFAGVYVLDPDRRDELALRIAGVLPGVDGVDLCACLDGAEAVVVSGGGELRFAPGGDLLDVRGERWSVEGDLGVLGLSAQDGHVSTPTYPDALRRLWRALRSRHSGDVLCSAAPGYEFLDWGGAHHIGGGSHGSLHRHDSLGALLVCGLEAGAGGPAPREQWSIEDVTPLVLDHFGVGREDGSAAVG
jgi:predicted AlkP superfamily pyrophosphatase or phosphodiesterase